MKTITQISLNYLIISLFALLLSACGGGSDGTSSDDGSLSDSGTLSLSLTDAPVTEDVDVCIHFTSVTLHHTDGDLIKIPYDPSTYTDATDCIDNQPSSDPDSKNNAVNLSALQGELSVQLVDSEEVKAGRYDWIRLDVVESLSYVMDSEGQQTLSCPSCEQSGLKLNRGITVPAGGEADFMIDIELAKSLNKLPSGDYKLRPTLRLIDLTETGSITGSVIPENDTGCKVYVYEGHGITPDDYHDTDNILTSTKVLYDGSGYTYVAAYLPTDSSNDPTPYTVALTCDEDDPDVDQNNDPSASTGADVIFSDGIDNNIGQDADVYTDQSTVVNFPPER